MKIRILQAELDEAKREIEELRKKIKKDDEIDSINKSTDSDITVDDVVVLEVKTIEASPEKLEVAEKEKVTPPIELEEEINPAEKNEVIVVEDLKEKEKEEVVVVVEKKDESMEVAEDIKIDEVEETKPEAPTKIELVEETESSKAAPVAPVAAVATTESDPNPKPEEVTKESS